MRFAYIDSNGNEVPIPSVDALALRIELGAINESTELYDAQADQWGPAHTHEIFHTLARAAGEGAGDFVAPPPPVPAPASTAVASEAAADEPEEPSSPEAKGAPEPPADPPAPPTPAPPAKEEDAIAGLTLADPLPTPDTEEAEVVDDGQAPVDPGDGGASFDFGDLSGGLDLEEPVGGEPSAMDFSASGGDLAGGSDPGDADAGDLFGEGLEQEMQFDAGGFGDLSDAPLDLERPMSDFSAEDAPSWMEPADGQDGGDVMDFSSVSSDTEAIPGAEPTARSQRAPKDRPSKPRFRRQRSMVGPIVAVVLLAAVGVGGYAAWPAVNAMWVARTTPPPPEAGLPPIPEGYEDAFRQAGASAFAVAIRQSRATVGAVVSPPDEWLAGVYLANAGDYAAVEVFWNGIREQLDAVRDVAPETLLASFESAAGSAGVAGDAQEALVARAEQGLRAGASARREVYDRLEALIEAALRLHDFLVANEENIEYTPASSVTVDPVLEARPATPQIRVAMEDRIDAVTDGLASLGYQDRVTADGLWSAVLDRVQQVGIR